MTSSKPLPNLPLKDESPPSSDRAPLDKERIEQDAQYAIGAAHSYVNGIPDGITGLPGKSVIELGPGSNFGAALILRCWGAGRVTVADRFLARFDVEYHVPLYQRIASILKTEDSNTITEPLDRCAAERSHLSDYVGTFNIPLEKLSEVAPDQFDVTLSNAVLEHLYHPLHAIQSLQRISRTPSVGLHQVDFRDHRDFSRPLEYLLLDEFSFHEMLTERNGECGNRLRPDEMQAMFVQAGFHNVHFTPDIWSKADYLDDFIPRLRASTSSPYSDIESARLAIVSGRFMIKKGP